MTARERLRSTRLARGVGRRFGTAAQSRAVLGRNGELEQHIQQLEQHIQHLEARSQVAEYRLAALDEFGLIDALSDDPASFARWLTWRPPGHFYSPVPNLHEIERNAAHLWPEDSVEVVPGVDLHPEQQLALFTEISAYARELTVYADHTEPWRYYSDNTAFGISDALVLHGMLRHIRPRRVIEIGSGYSSAMTLDTDEFFLNSETELTFIEPYPELLESLLKPADRDRLSIVAAELQTVPLERFNALVDGDILFIDSTHVLRTGSDVVYLYNELLPRLNPGVYVHIHDIFRGFEYPREWVMEGRAWTEVYMVRAFLTMNDQFEILLFNNWLQYFHSDLVRQVLPAILVHHGGSLWLRRHGPST